MQSVKAFQPDSIFTQRLKLIEKNNFVYPGDKMLGGEDFGYYVQKIPGCFVQLGCRNEKKGITHLWHDPRFDVDEDCIPYGMALHVELALGFEG